MQGNHGSDLAFYAQLVAKADAPGQAAIAAEMPAASPFPGYTRLK